MGATSAKAPIVVIGGGIVGLATARALRRAFPSRACLLLEKEDGVARHQTGHNSGVVHSGVYYAPGSGKARLCVEGRERLVAYLRERDLPYEECGKLIVAAAPSEIGRLEELGRRARLNGVPGVEWLDGHALRRREPSARGEAALWVPGTGITDYGAVAAEFRRDLERDGGVVRTRTKVLGGSSKPEGLTLRTTSDEIDARFVVNCGGLYCDRIARSLGDPASVTIVPFRGEYFRLRPERRGIVATLVYPVPDPTLPFLGVHFTRTIDGGVEVGPNAVWAFAREGYRWSDVRPGEALWSWTAPGFLRLARRHFGAGLYEMFRSLDRSTFARDLQRLVPEVTAADLAPGGSGVRAQAVTPEGRLSDDFVFQQGSSTLHVLNAPSPAATASLAIADRIVARIPDLS